MIPYSLNVTEWKSTLFSLLVGVILWITSFAVVYSNWSGIQSKIGVTNTLLSVDSTILSVDSRSYSRSTCTSLSKKSVDSTRLRLYI